MLDIVSYCATLSLRRAVLWCSTSKMSWPWNRDQRSLKVIESGIIR